MNDIIIAYLEKQGYTNLSTSYYTYIKLWKDWWRNDVDFHNYLDQQGEKRKMFSLGMAKRVGEDWASIITSEKDEIQIQAKNVTQTKKNNDYIKQKVKELNLYDDIPEQIEYATAFGTAGAVIRIKNATLNSDNSISANAQTKLDIIYINADQILPLRVEHGKITDVAFVSESNVGNKKEYYIEIHELIYSDMLQKDIYRIRNVYLDEKGNEIDKPDIAKEYTVNSDIPLFSILKTPTANSIRNNNGLGISMYGSAISQLQGCDIAYHNFVMDFKLGGKKVFYNKKIVGEMSVPYKADDGTTKYKIVPVYPDDITKQQFVAVGADTNLNKEDLMKEYNPDLRVEDNQKGIQFALDLLSFKAGLGTKYYEFNGSTVVTATQYTGDRQDLMKNAKKYKHNLDKFIGNICKGLLLIGRILFGEAVDENCTIEIVDKDGFLVDDETAKQEFRLDIAQGLRQPWEYRVRFLGEDEETAKAMINNEDITDIKKE